MKLAPLSPNEIMGGLIIKNMKKKLFIFLKKKKGQAIFFTISQIISEMKAFQLSTLRYHQL